MIARLWTTLALEAAVFGTFLFVPAGTLRWPAGWVFLVLFFVAAAAISQMLVVRNPDLLRERLKPLVQSGQPLWDRVVLVSMAVLFFAWLALMALDAERFRWSAIPVWLQIAGAAGIATGMAISYASLRENAYAIVVVRVQQDRGQRVISSGPYATVRHPLYAGAALLFPSTALLLGSVWGLGASIVLVLGVMVRTALEDRELQRGLEGYAAYAERVRARLVPFVW